MSLAQGPTARFWQAGARVFFYSIDYTAFVGFELKTFLFNNTQNTKRTVSRHTYIGLQGEASSPTSKSGALLYAQDIGLLQGLCART